jgi:hypothetical protein
MAAMTFVELVPREWVKSSIRFYFNREDDKEVRVGLEASNDAEDSLKEALQAAKGNIFSF